MKSLFVDGATKRECGGRWPAVHCRALWSLAIVLGSVVGSVQGYAAEEPERFLSKLRELGYFDTASEYLDFIAKSDLVDDAFKQTIPFEQAVTLKDRAARSGDVVKKQALLEQAIKAFGAFAAQHPDSTRSADVHLEVANVYSLLAQLTMTSVKRPNADRKKLEAEATDYYTKAISESKQAEAMLLSQRRKVKDELVELRKTVGNPNDPGRKVSKKEKDLIQLRSDLGFDWMLAKYRQVLILDQQSLVFEKGSDQWKQVVEKAAKAYEEFFFKFDRFTVGFIARVGQMRCLAAVGRFDEALDCLPDVTDFEESTLAHERKIWFNSFAIELECLIGKGEFKRAVDLSETKLKKSEVNTPQAKTILYLRAKAALALIDQLGPDKTKDKKKLREKAKRALETLVKTKSAYQAEAAEKLSSLGIEAKQPQEDAGVPATFDIAFRRGAAAMQQWGQLGKQAKQAPDGEKKKLQSQLAEQGTKAFDLYRTAISLVDNDTNPVKLRGVQKGLCYLYFTRGDFLEAAVIGDYLASNFPDSSEGKFGRQVALSCWLQEYRAAGEDNAFEKQRIATLANEIIEGDPGSSQAATAHNYLLTFAIQDGDVDTAWIHLEKLPDATPKIHKLKNAVGQLFWNRYSQSRRLSDDARPSAESLANDRDRAAEALAAGLAGVTDIQSVDYPIAQGAYVLAMLQLGENKPKEAIEVLENSSYGPLALIKAKHPAVEDQGYQSKAYRLALRAYIGALPLYGGDQESQNASVDKAFDIVNQLEKSVGKDANAESRLTKIYVDLGKDLELQIEGLAEAGNEAAKKALVDAFEMFLGRIKKSPAPSVSGELAKLGVTEATASDDQKKEAATNATKRGYRRLIWIAETYFTLGNSNRDSDSDIAQEYYEKAAKVYNSILNREMYSNPRQRTTIRLRLAECYRGMRNYKKALGQLVDVLFTKSGNLTAQLQAAETLYEAGEKNCGDYVKSILGDEEDEDTGNNIIWGWKKLAQQTGGNEAYASYFFRAKLYGVKARRKYAECMESGDEAKKRRLLSAAKGNLLQIYNQFPEFGGAQFKAEFESEMKQVQAALGEEQLGFPAPVETTEEKVTESKPRS